MPSLAGARAYLAQHRTVLLGAGAAAAAGVGLVVHHQKAAAGDAGAATTTDAYGYPAPNGATVAGYQPADTTGNDVYNALQPQIEQTQNLIGQLLDAIGAAGGGITKPPSGTPKPPKPSVPKTPNQTWLHNALKYLDSHGHTYSWSRAVLIRYLKGEKLSAAQQSVVNQAIAGAGRPPAPPKGATTARKVAAPAPHKAATDSAYVVRRSDTLATIAAANNTNIRAISQLNPGVVARPSLAPGTRLVVPNPQVMR